MRQNKTKDENDQLLFIGGGVTNNIYDFPLVMELLIHVRKQKTHNTLIL